MPLSDLSGVDSPSSKDNSITKNGKRKSSILAPWDLPGSKLLRNGRKSPIEDVETYGELWAYLKEENDYQLYKSEFASDDPIVRGVALSRTAQGIAAICDSIVTVDAARLKSVLNTETYDAMKKEAAELLDYVKVLDGSGLPSRADSGPKTMLGKKTYEWKDPDKVKDAAGRFLSWLTSPSKIRSTMEVLQLGGLFYSTHVDILCMNAYIKCGGGDKEAIVNAAQKRLCQGKSVPITGERIRPK